MYIVKEINHIMLMSTDAWNAVSASLWVRVIMSRIAALEMIQIKYLAAVVVIVIKHTLYNNINN